MAVRIAIAGFGRIGRSIFRIGYRDPDIEIAAVSDLSELDSLAYLLRHSTVEGPLQDDVRIDGSHLMAGPQRVRYIRGATPGMIPWDVLGVDVVLECTGQFRHRTDLQKHLEAGARKVLLSTPALDPIDRTIINGINDAELLPADRIVSNGSSSSHALALTLKVLNDASAVDWAMMTTVHAVTGDQQLSDTAKPSPRWSRSAAKNIIPNTSWAPSAVEAMMPSLRGKIRGVALNVPVMVGSNIDLVAGLGSPLEAEDVNRLFAEAAASRYRGLIDYTDEPIVSSDVRGNRASAVFDGSATMVSGRLVKTLTWFDNGWAYAARMLDLARRMALER